MGFHFLLQGIFPNPGMEPVSPALLEDSLPSESQESFGKVFSENKQRWKPRRQLKEAPGLAESARPDEAHRVL